MDERTWEVLKIVITIGSSALGVVLTTMLGFMAYWLKGMSDQIKDNTKVLAELSSRVGLLDARTEPIPEMVKDMNDLHNFKRQFIAKEKQ